MGDCANTDYQMMDLHSLFEFQNTQLLRATITSIDGENNKAAISFIDTCDIVMGIDTSEVEFFYHCEYSTGTIEDLAEGYKAFSVGDSVYTIYIPPSGSNEEHFYIIGHADIKGTRICETSEYLLIFADAGWRKYRWDAVFGRFIWEEDFTVTWITVYDTARGEVLALEEFVNIDENSPQKPDAIPTKDVSGFLSWFNYNFRQSNAPTTARVSVETYNLGVTNTVASYFLESRNSSNVPTPAANPYCEWTDNYELRLGSSGEVLSEGDMELQQSLHYGTLVDHEYLSGNTTHSRTSEIKEGLRGWKFSDPDSSTEYDNKVKSHGYHNANSSYSLDGTEGIVTTGSFNSLSTIEVDCIVPFNAHSFTESESGAFSGSESSDTPWIDGDLWITGPGSYLVLPGGGWTSVQAPNIWNPKIVNGELGYYTVVGIDSSISKVELKYVRQGISQMSDTGDVCGILETSFNGGGAEYWREGFYHSLLENSVYDFKAFSTVTMFDAIENIDISNPIPFNDIVNNINLGRSGGLSSVLDELLWDAHEDAFSEAIEASEAGGEETRTEIGGADKDALGITDINAYMKK